MSFQILLIIIMKSNVKCHLALFNVQWLIAVAPQIKQSSSMERNWTASFLLYYWLQHEISMNEH